MYSTLDVAYNDNTEILDKMARDLNNKKKTLFKSVEKDFNNKQQKWENDIIEYNNSYKNPYDSFTSHPNNNNNNINNESDDYNNYNDDDEFSEIQSIDSISIESPSLDSYIDTVKKLPNKKKSVHKFIQDLENTECSKDDEDVFTHIKYCYDCKEKLLKYMKNTHKNKNNKKHITYDSLNDSDNNSDNSDNNTDNSNNNNSNSNNNINKLFNQIKNKESLFSYFGTLQTKEIFLILVLGIVLIIFLDFLMKSTNKF